MVSTVKKILDLISKKQFLPMKKWSSRKRINQNTKFKKSLIKDIRKVLENISGNDLISMIKGDIYELN